MPCVYALSFSNDPDNYRYVVPFDRKQHIEVYERGRGRRRCLDEKK